MTRTRLLLPIVSLACALPFTLAPAPRLLAAADLSAEAGWAVLFDGRSLQGWRGYRQPDAARTRWQVADGLLTLPPKGAGEKSVDIITTETFDRFDLEFEWRVSPGGNSGVKYFVLEDRDSAVGHEYQIIDDAGHADAKVGAHRQTAAFYDVLPPRIPAGTIKPAGEWNRGRVRVEGSAAGAGGARVLHEVNGVRVLDYELDSPELRAAIARSKFKDVARFGKLQKGHILLQDHNDQVWYRNVRIQRLGTT